MSCVQLALEGNDQNINCPLTPLSSLALVSLLVLGCPEVQFYQKCQEYF